MMSRIKWYVFLTMDKMCDVTGHRVFQCWNGPGQRLWVWANDLLPDEEWLQSEPRDDAAE